VNEEKLREMLQALQDGKTDVDAIIENLRSWPYEDIGFARVDHHRTLRRGFPEVIFGEGKSVDQIIKIMEAMLSQGTNVLVTRVDAAKAKDVQKQIKTAVYDDISRTLIVRQHEVSKKGQGLVLVLAAGTSDIPVAEEAAVTAEMIGSRVERLFDVGVCRRGRVAPPARSFPQDEGGQRAGSGCRYGRSTAQRGGRYGGEANCCRAYQCGLWCFIQGIGRTDGYAQRLRSGNSCGKHRQRLRRRLPCSPY
jgi:hypothetical protein